MINNLKEIANEILSINYFANDDMGEVPGFVNAQKLNFPAPEIIRIDYNGESYTEKLLDEIPSKQDLVNPETVSWLIINGFGDEHFIDNIHNKLGVHKLALEDTTSALHPPKLEFFDDSIFLLLRLVLASEDGVDSSISIFLYENTLILFSPDNKFNHAQKIIGRIKNNKGIVRTRGNDYLLFTIIDIVLDSYFPQLEHITTSVKEIDHELFEEKNVNLLHELKTIRQVLNVYYDNLIPLKNMLKRLLRSDMNLIAKEHVKYYNDASDQVSFLCERINRLKESTSDIMNLSISINGQKMNEVMKMLTIISSVFIPLSFIAGLYGMNFDASKSPYNMPELSWTFGYPFALGLMVIVSLMMLIFFRKKKWL